MKEIRGDAKNIRALLGEAKYAIDYYQREYRWQTKQISELLDDLADKFRDHYEPSHDREEVTKAYGHYFLGSIIISDKDGCLFIIDGQQRLTSITLLLIFLYRKLESLASERKMKFDDERATISNLIFSYRLLQK